MRFSRMSLPVPPSIIEVSVETARLGHPVSSRRISLAERNLLDLPEADRAAVERAGLLLSERKSVAAPAEAASLKPAHQKGQP